MQVPAQDPELIPVPNSRGESSAGYSAGNEVDYNDEASVVIDVGSSDENYVGIFSRIMPHFLNLLAHLNFKVLNNFIHFFEKIS